METSKVIQPQPQIPTYVEIRVITDDDVKQEQAKEKTTTVMDGVFKMPLPPTIKKGLLSPNRIASPTERDPPLKNIFERLRCKETLDEKEGT